MSDWDGLADDIALTWWLSDRDRERAATEDEARSKEDDNRAREWTFRRDVALRGATIAAQRWETYLSGRADSASVTPVRDPAAVRYLATVGFSERAALAALQASGWRGMSTEERTVEAILTPPR